jgi:DNA-binding response OmpR family regulator
MPALVLLLDPDPAACAEIVAGLRARGHVVRREQAPEELLAALKRAPPPGLVLLRRATPPPWCGLETLRRLRARSPVPCILLGGADEDPAVRVAAFEAGADDYLHVAMHTVEALARIQAVLRRAGLAPPGLATPGLTTPGLAPPLARPAASVPAAWNLSVGTRRLTAPDGSSVRLTAAEIELLRLLAGTRGEPVDRDVICRQVFRRPWRAEDRSVDGLVKRLRRKMDADSIQAVRGVGYALSAPIDAR